MHLGTKLAAVALSGGATALVLAGGPAMASTHHRALTGREVIYGHVRGRAALSEAPRVPVRFRGVVRTHGVVNLGGPSSRKNHSIPTRAGIYAVRLTSERSRTHVNRRTCRVRNLETDTYVVRGRHSTGVFHNASGHGVANIEFQFTVSRYTSGRHRGECNLSRSGHPVHPRTARVTFLAVSTLTVRR